MAYKIPWSNFHELNLDWLLEQVKQLREDVDNITGSATPSSSIPEMDGVGSPGTEDNYARGDHRHPTDSSRAAQSDLTQEITDRGNADLALASDIADVDAKIKFSAAAPIMDSSSASAGFSDFIARADHIHPTDTSRASATDLATLTARVDNIVGAASPYDVTPLMDGVGTSGTVGAYSRGDHQHPSDTSKLDKTGGAITGNLEIEGILTLDTREQHFVSDAIAWVRIATVPQVAGTRCTFKIVRKGTLTPAETHEVTLVILQTALAFVDERSNSDVLYIDKIRYSDAGGVDIHIDQSAESQIGIFLDAQAPTAAQTAAIELGTPEGVADAPAGETLLATYSFSENTVTDISGEFVLNTNLSGVAGSVYAIFNSFTQTVDVDFSVYASDAFGSMPVFTCNNQAHMPKTTSNGTAMIHNKTSDEWYPYRAGINTSGEIAQGYTGAADRMYGHIKYKV